MYVKITQPHRGHPPGTVLKIAYDKGAALIADGAAVRCALDGTPCKAHSVTIRDTVRAKDGSG